MRKTLFILFLSAITIPTIAQKGTTLLYGTVTYYDASPLLGDGSILSINPGIGFGFSDKWTAGLNVIFGKVNASYEATSYGGGPFVRYTHPLSDMFSVFTQFETSYSIQDISSQGKNKVLRFAFFPAIEMNIKNGFALNFSLGSIDYSNYSFENDEDSNAFNLALGSGLSVGVSKRFGRKN
jgi:hypothetical protein